MAAEDARDRELELLRAENERLRAMGEQTESEGRRRHGWRWPVAIVLLVLGGVLLAAAVPALWAGRTLLDTDRYTETVAPLASDPEIRHSVAVSAVDGLFGRVDVENEVEAALPPKAAFVAPQITAGLRDFAITAADRALSTEQFQTLWTEANREAHQRIVPTLLTGTGRAGALSVDEGAVTVDLTTIVSRVKEALVSRGLTVVANVPDDVAGGTVPLFESAQIAQLQTFLRAVQGLSIALPILAVLVLAAAVAFAPDRRRALLWVGATTIVAMLALGVGLAMLRDAYVASPPAGILSAAAATSFFDTLTRFLLNAIRTVAAIGLVLLVGSALAGPSTVSQRIRGAVTSGTSALGLDLGRPAEWTDRHRRGLEVLIVVAAAVALFASNTPSPGLVIGLAIAVLVGFLIVELVAHSHPSSATGHYIEPSM